MKVMIIVCLKAKPGRMLRIRKLKKIFLLSNVQYHRRILLSLQLDEKRALKAHVLTKTLNTVICTLD